MLLLQPAPDLIVDWIEVWTIRRPLHFVFVRAKTT